MKFFKRFYQFGPYSFAASIVLLATILVFSLPMVQGYFLDYTIDTINDPAFYLNYETKIREVQDTYVISLIIPKAEMERFDQLVRSSGRTRDYQIGTTKLDNGMYFVPSLDFVDSMIFLAEQADQETFIQTYRVSTTAKQGLEGFIYHAKHHIYQFTAQYLGWEDKSTNIAFGLALVTFLIFLNDLMLYRWRRGGKKDPDDWYAICIAFLLILWVCLSAFDVKTVEELSWQYDHLNYYEAIPSPNYLNNFATRILAVRLHYGFNVNSALEFIYTAVNMLIILITALDLYVIGGFIMHRRARKKSMSQL